MSLIAKKTKKNNVHVEIKNIQKKKNTQFMQINYMLTYKKEKQKSRIICFFLL